MIDTKYGFIKGLSDKRRLPLLGKVRLGVKKISTKSGKEYPAEVDYFVVPDEVKKVFGDKPKELEIMFPVAARHVIFPTAYRCYGQSRGLKCIGNGETATEWSDDKKTMVEHDCPCEKIDKKECAKRAFLMFMIPRVSLGGVYQLVTSSFNSIVDINSGLDYLEALVGRVQMIPVTLSRVAITTHFEGKPQTHYTLRVIFTGNAEFVNQLRENNKQILLEMSVKRVALPAPKDENPEMDEGAVVEAEGITDEENEKKDAAPVPEQPTPAKEKDVSEKIGEECFGGDEKLENKSSLEEVIEKDVEKIQALTCEQVAKKIVMKLKELGFEGRKDKEGMLLSVRFVRTYNQNAKKYSDLEKPELVSLYYAIATSGGDENRIIIPF